MQIIRDLALILFQAQRIKGIKNKLWAQNFPSPQKSAQAQRETLPTLLFISYIRAVKAVLPAQVTALQQLPS